MTNLQRDNASDSLFVGKMQARCPQASDEHLRALASVWEQERHQIIEQMLAISAGAIGKALHIDARPEAIFEMAKLNLWLVDRMIEHKLSTASDEPFDPASQRTLQRTELATQRIENTARILAEQIWNKIMAKLRKRWPLVATISDAPAAKRLIKDPSKRAPKVRRNHYSPVSCNKYWAGADGRMVRVYSRGLNGAIVSKDMSCTQWGHEQFLYSDRLESYLGLVDDDGASTCRKLLDIIPLTELDKRRWIAFLAIQMIRTPSFLKTMFSHLKRVVPEVAPDYRTDVPSLKAAYESLFANNDFYARFHRLIAPRQWMLRRAPTSTSFIRPDNPVLITGSITSNDWCLTYPMTPSTIFQAGPSEGNGYDSDFVSSANLDVAQCSCLNARLAAAAENSVLTVPLEDDTQLRELLTAHLGTNKASQLAPSHGLWGPIA